jgi:RNA polymerase sigma-70 factor (ECF subfamily)
MDTRAQDWFDAAVASARAAHPAVGVDPAALRSRLEALVPPGTDAAEAIAALEVGSIHLALACARGDRAALEILERQYLPAVRTALARERLTPERIDETVQQLREQVLVARADRPPRIADYGGRGDLGRWLRAVAVHLAVDQARATGRELPVGDDDLIDRALATDDPVLEHLKMRYASEVRAALRDALGALDVETRTDLRLYYLDRLTLEEVAALRRVAISTVSRRIARAREATLSHLRRALGARLGVPPGEVDSILALVGSRLELPDSALL